MAQKTDKERAQKRKERQRYYAAHPEKKRDQVARAQKAARARLVAAGKLRAHPGRPSGKNPILKHARRQRARFKQFGLTAMDFHAMLESQDHKCAICELPLPAGAGGGKDGRHIDHCHRTGKVRGIVHRNCNLLLGLARDSITLLQHARDYLVRHGAIEQPPANDADDASADQFEPRQDDLFESIH